MITIKGTKVINVHKKHNFFLSIHTDAGLVKLVEPILLMGALPATPKEPASIYHKAMQ